MAKVSKEGSFEATEHASVTLPEDGKLTFKTPVPAMALKIILTGENDVDTNLELHIGIRACFKHICKPMLLYIIIDFLVF